MDQELSRQLNNLTLENPLNERDQEIEFRKIYKNTNIVRDFFDRFHTVSEIKRFIDEAVLIFKMYLNMQMFNQTYINVPELFLQDMRNYKKGFQFFVTYYNEDHFEYNIEFITNISKHLQDFLYYHYYDTGFLR